MSPAHGAVVFLAAVVAGLLNSVAGGGTLISFPALVWLGLDPIVANASNAVALWPGSLASAIGFRRELRGGTDVLRPLVAPTLLGSLAGAILLLRTPSRTFAVIVPYLILFATVLFATQEPITRLLYRRRRHPKTRTAGEARREGTAGSGWIAAVVFQFCVAVYGGYFGAGMGILMLAALGVLGFTDIHHMNGVKNALAVCVNAVAAAYFALSGAVSWPDATVMAAGAIVGGYGGAGLARRLGRRFVRRIVIAIGVAMAVSLFLRPP